MKEVEMEFWTWYIRPIKKNLLEFGGAFLSFKWILSSTFEMVIGFSLVGVGIAGVFFLLVYAILALIQPAVIHPSLFWSPVPFIIGATMASHGVWRETKIKQNITRYSQ
ncbi:hypothetical protein KKE60_04370 [Patescibacteria group bacterium]|nr:hypothetical protein [Patescibacteria group bacterium]